MPLGWVAAGTAVAGLAGAAMQSSAAQDAAQTQANAANNAAQVGYNEFNTITQQEQPFMQGGYGALSALQYGLGLTPPSQPTAIPATGSALPGYDPSSGWQIGGGGFLRQLIPGGGMSTWQQGTGPLGGSGIPTAASSAPAGPQGTGLGYGSLLTPFTADYMRQYSPAYQFQLQQGQQGVLNGDTSGMGALSGAAQKDLMSFNQNEANTAFSNAFNQYQAQQGNIYQRLAGLAQLGQSSAANTGQQGTALAGNIAQSVTNAGSALAAGQVGSANAWAGGLSNLGSLAALYGGGGGGTFSDPYNYIGGGGQANDALAEAGFSDQRLKRDIERIGTLNSGIPVYRYRFVDGDKVHVGVLAQEVERVIPDAVSIDSSGYLKVDHGKLR